jgi:integrase/recombinase XerD
MPTFSALDARGRRRSPVTIVGHKRTKPPATKGKKYPPEPLPIDDIVKLLAACTPQRPGWVGEFSAIRLRALIVVLWRTGMRCAEMLALEDRDLQRQDLTIVIRCGKGGKRRLVMMDEWGWVEFERYLARRAELPPGQSFCVAHGATAGRALCDSDVRRQLRQAGVRASCRHRIHAHAFRHTFSAEAWREGIDLFRLQRQLGHAHLGVTEAYLRGITVTEILGPIGQRHAPMMVVPSSLLALSVP